MNRLLRLASLLTITFAASSALAIPSGTPQQAKTMFDRAVAYMQAQGPEKAFQAFNDRGGSFVKGDLYVFAIDLDGTYKATGLGSDALVGSNVRDTRDAYGKPLFQEMIALAKTKGEGTMDYVWLNRATNTVDHKTSHIKRVGDYVVGVGYYVPRADAERARRFFDRAVARMQQVGAEKASASFNDPSGEFVKGDLYVFVFDLDGRYKASGAAPQLVGSAVKDMTDAMGTPVVKDIIANASASASAKGEATVDYLWRNPVTNKMENKRSYVKKVGEYVLGVGYYQG
jgi:cytochrome c